MARIFLHIGYPKTGTTSLQQFFAQNAETLRSNGILYPWAGRNSIAHYGLSTALVDGQQLACESIKTQLAKEIEESGCESVLISSEGFIAAKSFDPIVSFFAGHDVDFVIYLRRHDHALESAYSQSVCLTANPPWNPGIDSFVLYQMGISTVPWDYWRTLSKLAAIVGKNHVIVRPFEREQNLPDLYADFLKVVGLEDSDAFARPNKERNPSLPYRTLATIDSIMRSAVGPEMKQQYAEVLARIHSGTKGEMPFLSPRMRIAVLARYRMSYAMIAREFMRRDDGVLFKEPAPMPNQPWSPPTTVSVQEAVDLVLRAAPAIAEKEQPMS